MTEDQELRIDALRLAAHDFEAYELDIQLEAAQRFYEFLTAKPTEESA